jgi:hypothetical protein
MEMDPMAGLFGTYDDNGEPIESSAGDYASLTSDLAPLSSVNMLAPITASGIDTTLDPSTSAFNPTEMLFTTMSSDLTGNVMTPDLGPPPDPPPSDMPVPGALGTPGTQASDFGTITGLGNPFLTPIMLIMQDRYTSVNPFDPPVQPGSPDAVEGVTPISGGPVVFPEPGQPLPPGTSPPFIPVPTIDTTSLPGALPPVGHANFVPGETGPVLHPGFHGAGEGGFGGSSGGSGGPFMAYIPTGVPVSTWAAPVNPTSYKGMAPASTAGSAQTYEDAGAQARQAAVQTGQPVYIYDQWGNLVSEVNIEGR